MKRALTQAFTKIDENLICEFSRQVGTSYVTFKKQLFTHEIAITQKTQISITKFHKEKTES